MPSECKFTEYMHLESIKDENLLWVMEIQLSFVI